MTIDLTRLLAVEFERRVNAIDPSTESVNKLDTDTIYSYLNQYQQQYIQLLYLMQGSELNTSRTSIRLEDAAKDLICRQLLGNADVIDTDILSKRYNLPSNYYMYIRSNSVVTGTYKNFKKGRVVPNIVSNQSGAASAIRSYYDIDGIIRNPIIVMDKLYTPGSNGSLLVFHDRYTKIYNVELIYYRQPQRFNIIDNTCCELSYQCFDDLVSGAVELYFTYRYKVALAENDRRRKAALNRQDRRQEESQ